MKRIGLQTLKSVRSNLNASAEPGNTDDISKGYSRGSVWVDRVNDLSYYCVDNTLNNAVWCFLSVSSGDNESTISSASFTISPQSISTEVTADNESSLTSAAITFAPQSIGVGVTEAHIVNVSSATMVFAPQALSVESGDNNIVSVTSATFTFAPQSLSVDTTESHIVNISSEPMVFAPQAISVNTTEHHFSEITSEGITLTPQSLTSNASTSDTECLLSSAALAVAPQSLSSEIAEHHFSVVSSAALTIAPQSLSVEVEGNNSSELTSATLAMASQSLSTEISDNNTSTLTSSFLSAAPQSITVVANDNNVTLSAESLILAPQSITVEISDAFDSLVASLSPDYWWKLDESSSPFADSADSNTGTGTGTYTTQQSVYGYDGVDFDGSSGYVYTANNISNPQNFTIFALINASEGCIIGFSDSQSGLPGSFDRLWYIDVDGKLYWGVYSGGLQKLNSGTALSAGEHVVACSIGSAGMKLYVDGSLVDSNGITTAANYSGYWRIGHQYLGGGWSSGSHYLDGIASQVVIFDSQLDDTDIEDLYYAVSDDNRLEVSSASLVITPQSLSTETSG